MKKIQLLYKVIRSLLIFIVNELRRGTLTANIRGLGKMEVKEEMSWGELLEEKVKCHGNRIFLTFEEKNYTYRDMDNNANKIAAFFSECGGGQGLGVAIVEGQTLEEKELVNFIKDDLPKFAVPRYIRIVDEFPKTETFRIKKKEIEDLGIASGTYDSIADCYV